MNILASTTRQWNCGDELILFGVINIFKKKYNSTINCVIYNRNPDVLSSVKKIGNNWNGQSLAGFDKIILAGTPKWAGKALIPLFRKINNERRQPIFIGIGYSANNINFSELDKKVLRNSEIIITRDIHAQNCCKNIGLYSVIMPCPCLFSSNTENIKSNNKIGVVYQSDKTKNQSINTHLKKHLHKIIEFFNAEVICHYTDEYFEAINKYKKVHYSFDAKDYLEIYNQFDLIISTRLHGAITALSCGTPSILLDNINNPRLQGAANVIPYLQKSNSLNSIKELINSCNIKEWSINIINFKKAQEKEYFKLI